MVSTTQTKNRLWWMMPIEVNRPTVNSSESPGRMANSPHSAKMTKATPHRAYGPKKLIRNSGSIQDGSSIGVSRAASSAVTG